MTSTTLPELPNDLVAIRAELMDAVVRDARRRARRRGSLRTAAIAASAAVGLTGTAFAAGAALGVIDLGNGIHAQHVNSYPAYNVTTHQFVQVRGAYIYHMTGGRTNLSACPGKPNDIYVEATKPLTAAQLKTASEMATGAIRAVPPGPVPGLKSVSDGCGNAGVEATVGTSPSGKLTTPPPQSHRPTFSEQQAQKVLEADGQLPTTK